MKKMKYLLLLIVVLALSGCRLLSNNENGIIRLEVDDNLRVSYYEHENYDWTNFVKLNYMGKEISADQLKIELITENVDIGTVAEYKVTYGDFLKLYTGSFFALVTDGHYMISDLKNAKDNTLLKVKGTVSNTSETGFILSDSTGSIYIYKENALEAAKENNNFIVLGTYSNGVVKAESLYYYEYEKAKYPSKTIDSREFKDYFDNDFKTTHITTDGVVRKDENQIYYISLDDGSKLKIDGKNNSEISALSSYLDNRINFTGWVYRYDENSNSFYYMHEEVNYQIESTDVGNMPVIKAETDYFYFTETINLSYLLTNFDVTDYEDGQITLSTSNLIGSLNEEQNIITLQVYDSDNNMASYSFVVEIDSKTNYINESVSTVNPYGMPTSGTVKVLVIPIGFDNYKKTPEMRTNIEKAFFGKNYNTNTGWESLSAYYYKSSYGKLNITGTVTDWYTPKRSESYYAKYEDSNDYYIGSTLLLEEALEYFSNKYDYSSFDANKDGYIDAVYMIYNNPIGGNGFGTQEEFYWAFTSWDYNVDSRDYANVKGFSYVFMGYEFFLQNTSYVNVYNGLNCETVVHETGHLLGLVDYYDYDESDRYNKGGYGGCDMMDHNIGDHGPYSKILLNWVEPVVVSRSGIYQIPSFTTSGTTLLIPANGTFSTIYDEYYLIDLYTYDGLNKLHMPSFFQSKSQYAGIRVSHVNSSLEYDREYLPYFKYDNTDTKNKMITILEADYIGDFHIVNSYSTLAQTSDFYAKGQTFGNGYYSDYTSHKGNEIPFTMEVLNIYNGYATVKIVFK